jgi:hypothetical protein
MWREATYLKLINKLNLAKLKRVGGMESES